MKTEMVMPQMGESIAEATVLKWLKGVGDKVEKDETILEISTDKVDSEIPAPASGVLVELKAQEGDTVPVKSIIAVIDSEGGMATPSGATAASGASGAATTSGAAVNGASNGIEEAQIVSQPASAQPAAAIPPKVGERFYSPLVRSLAAQHGISADELAAIPGSGTHGRVTKNDVNAFLETRGASPQAQAPVTPEVQPAAPKPAAPQPAAPRSAPAPAPAVTESMQYGADGTSIEPFDNMRKMIAEHMVRSKATSPHVYSMAEADVTNVAKWRQQKQSAFLAREGFKLSYTPFFLEAAVKALLQFPRVNASVDGDKLILKRDVNLGCAVALGSTGLIVPVIKSADQLSLVGIARSLTDIATRARNKQLQPDDIHGGTFTVTNPGGFGNIIGCPIINQPQLAILSLGAIKKRPVVVDDAIAIRDIVYLTLSYDHRVIDGSLGGQFLQYIVKYLENWNMDRELG